MHSDYLPVAILGEMLVPTVQKVPVLSIRSCPHFTCLLEELNADVPPQLVLMDWEVWQREAPHTLPDWESWPPVILVAPAAVEDAALSALNDGVTDYLLYNEFTADRLVRSIRHARSRGALLAQLDRIQRKLAAEHERLASFLRQGASSRVNERLAREVQLFRARSEGESGEAESESQETETQSTPHHVVAATAAESS